MRVDSSSIPGIWVSVLVVLFGAGCGSDATPFSEDDTDADDVHWDTGMDPAPDVPVDTLVDSTPDVPADTGVDTAPDVAPDGPAVAPPSCEGMTGDECGGDDCCSTDDVAGGWFAMGRGEGVACPSMPVPGAICSRTPATCFGVGTTWSCPEGTWIELGGNDADAAGGTDEIPEHAVLVDGFGMDRYEVTVGRMRRFVEGYDRDALVEQLSAGAGAHPGIADSAWHLGWNTHLPVDAGALQSALRCDDTTQTWTASAAGNETYPINCVSWFVAYAFCAWDGGRLPTSAEWEAAAAGGDENRLYPWGSAAPGESRANYLDTDNTTYLDVFAKPMGAGRYGHLGLAGSVWEWVLDCHEDDWYAVGGWDCENCANTCTDGARTMRGGDFQYQAADLRAASVFPGTAAAYWLGSGFRCVRDP